MIDINDLMQEDAIYWAVKNEISLLGGTTFTLDGCKYMADIMRDPARHIAVRKGTQARITTLFMLRAIHALIYGKRPQGVLYYFPTKEDVERFSKTRFGPLIADNPCIRKNLKNTNSVFVKRIGKTFLTLLGARATVDIQGKKDAGSLRQTSADEVIRDERDLFDDDMAEMTCDRLGNSALKIEADLGSPTIPDIGIDRVFSESDQKYWLVKCRSCNQHTCISEEFPESIKYARDTTHESFEPYYACIKCGKKIFVEDGEFVAKFPDRYNPKNPKRGISGYHISQFMTPNCDLYLVMDKYEKCTIDAAKLGLFYNRVLGLPYIALEERLRRQDVFSCCGDDIMKPSSTVGTAMGADIMKTNRVIIAEKKGEEKAKIIYMARVSGFDALYNLVGRFNVQSAVVCLRPYEESFRKFQAKCKLKNVRVFGAEYRDKQRNLLKTDDKSGIYVIARTEMMDKSHAWIKSGKLEIPRRCEEVEIFAKEVCNTAKVLETNELTGDRVYRYRPVGDKEEHYRHTINYLLLALKNLYDYQIQPEPVLAAPAGDDWDPLRFGL